MKLSLIVVSMVILVLLPIGFQRARALPIHRWTGTLQPEISGHTLDSLDYATFGVSGNGTFAFNVSDQGLITGNGTGHYSFGFVRSQNVPPNCSVRTTIPFNESYTITGSVTNGLADLDVFLTSSTLSTSVFEICFITTYPGVPPTPEYILVPLPSLFWSYATASGLYSLPLQDDVASTKSISYSAEISGRTNIHVYAFPPTDFTISSSTSVGSAATYITVYPINDFNSSVTLSFQGPSGVECALSQYDVRPNQIAKLTCTGQPGMHAVTIIGTSGSKSHNVTFTVETVSARSSLLDQTPVYSGLGALAVIAVVVLLASFRRRPSQVA